MFDRDRLKKQLYADEDVRYFPYDDATGQPFKQGQTLRGKLTVGVGRNLTDRPLTADEVNYLLDNDVNIATIELDRALPWWRQLSDARQEVLLNMSFNLGIAKLLTFKNTLAYMQAGRYDAAADGMKNSQWAQQVGARATRLITMMRNG